MEMKRKQPHEMVESKEAKLQVETAAEFDANENVEPPQPPQQQHQQPQTQQQPSTIKQDQNAAPAAAIQHHDHDSEPKISHAQVHDISHGEPVILRINESIFKIIRPLKTIKSNGFSNNDFFVNRHSSPGRTSTEIQGTST